LDAVLVGPAIHVPKGCSRPVKHCTAQIDRRIQAFAQLKRRENDASNVVEFCAPKPDYGVCVVRTATSAAWQPQLTEAWVWRAADVCARTNPAAIARHSKKSHLKVSQAANETGAGNGPQVLFLAPGLCCPLWTAGRQRALNLIAVGCGAVRQDASTASAATATGGVSHGTDERLANMEAHLGIERAPGTCAP
jgi:hypothetical protein